MSAVLSAFLGLIGRIIADVLKDFLGKPTVISVDIAPSCLEEADTGYTPDVDALVDEWVFDEV